MNIDAVEVVLQLCHIDNFFALYRIKHKQVSDSESIDDPNKPRQRPKLKAWAAASRELTLFD